MRFDRNLETGYGVRLCILSVVLIAVVGSFLFVVSRVVGGSAGGHAAVGRRMDRADQAGIEELHRKDVAATLASDPKLLAELWTDDAVRLQPGGPAEVGLTVIRENDRKQLAEHPAAKVLSYRPEIKDVQIVGDWAFEWNDFEASYRETPDGKTVSLHGKALRVLKKQSDGSWRFARVMWNLNE
jgi:uncharacterized protein (TIGR02246 family)